VSKDTHLDWLIEGLMYLKRSQGGDDGFNPKVDVAWVGEDGLGVALGVGGWRWSLDDALDEALEVLRWRRDFRERDSFFFGEVKKRERNEKDWFIYGFDFAKEE